MESVGSEVMEQETACTVNVEFSFCTLAKSPNSEYEVWAIAFSEL